MTNEKRKEEQTTTRRVAEVALDVAIGGTALAADKAVETVEKVVEQAQDAARSVRSRVDPTDSRPYEERTRDELYALAADRDIAGRSNMNKDELIFALRAER